jgi:hypothetical protein
MSSVSACAVMGASRSAKEGNRELPASPHNSTNIASASIWPSRELDTAATYCNVDAFVYLCVREAHHIPRWRETAVLGLRRRL